jgi:hypothetical protein
MIAMPIARKHAAASNGATGPKPKFSARRFANSPDTMAIKPFPRKMALENVMDSHCGSKPLCKREKKGKYSDSVGPSSLCKKRRGNIFSVCTNQQDAMCPSPEFTNVRSWGINKTFAASGRSWHFVSQAAATALDPWILLIIIIVCE